MTVYTEQTGEWRTPGGHSVRFAYREGTNDWNTLSATMTEDEYHLPTGLGGHGVDVGGYLGSVGIGLALDNPTMRVTIVEPVLGNGDLIERNIVLNGLSDRVTLIRGAMSGKHEPITVWYGYRGNASAEHHAFVGNSSLAYDHGGALVHDEVTYDAMTLDDLAPIDWLKIDCEGGEWSILSGDNSGIPIIVGEAHSVRGHTGGDIVDLLAATHDVTVSGDPAATCEFKAVRR